VGVKGRRGKGEASEWAIRALHNNSNNLVLNVCFCLCMCVLSVGVCVLSGLVCVCLCVCVGANEYNGVT